MKTTPLYAAALLALGLATTSCEKEEPLQPTEKAEVVVDDPEDKKDDGEENEAPDPEPDSTPDPAPRPKNPDVDSTDEEIEEGSEKPAGEFGG